MAQGGVDAARAADGRAATDALLAGTATPPASLPAARAAVVACEDALAAATTARDALQAEIAELEGHAFYRDAKVHTAPIAVMRDEMAPTTRALIAEIGAHDARRADLGKALALLVSHGIIKAQGPDAMPGVLELQCRFDSMREDFRSSHSRRARHRPLLPGKPRLQRWRPTLPRRCRC